jgi:hypothetical protein
MLALPPHLNGKPAAAAGRLSVSSRSSARSTRWGKLIFGALGRKRHQHEMSAACPIERVVMSWITWLSQKESWLYINKVERWSEIYLDTRAEQFFVWRACCDTQSCEVKIFGTSLNDVNAWVHSLWISLRTVFTDLIYSVNLVVTHVASLSLKCDIDKVVGKLFKSNIDKVVDKASNSMINEQRSFMHKKSARLNGLICAIWWSVSNAQVKQCSVQIHGQHIGGLL